MALSVTVWPQYTFVTNRQTDRQTHGHDDRNSDPLLTVTVAKKGSQRELTTVACTYYLGFPLHRYLGR